MMSLHTLLLVLLLDGAFTAISPDERPVMFGPDGFEPYADPIDGPEVRIVSPRAAQLFVEDRDDVDNIRMEYEVKNFELGPGKGEVRIYFLPNTVQSGLHAFDTIPDTPYQTSYDQHLILNLPDLPFGLHFIFIKLVSLSSGESPAQAAVYFETRYIADLERHEPKIDQSIVEKSFLYSDNEAEWQPEDTARFLSNYAKLHSQILDPNNHKTQKRFVIMDNTMGGLGNRLGSIISGALLAFVTDRALIVASDLPRYFLQGHPATGGIAWNFGSVEEARRVVKGARGESDETTGISDELYFDDMWELTEMLTCMDLKETLSDRTSIVIKSPHYFAPFLFANPFTREKLYSLFGDDASGIVHRFLFSLKPYLQEQVERFRASVGGRHLIGLQIRQDHSCDNITFTNAHSERVRSRAFMTYEHERLWFTCAKTLGRGVAGYPNSVAYFIASDLPMKMREIAIRQFGYKNIVFSPLETDPEKERDQMSSMAGVDFGGALLDMWLLGECKEIIATPASSFGWMGAARASIHPYLVTKWGKCVQPITKQPFCHGQRLLEYTSCFNEKMYVPENDMICQDCVSLQCPCGSLTCGSHSEPKASLFPRGACRLQG